MDKPCIHFHYLICPINIFCFLLGFTRILLLIKEIFYIHRSQISTIPANQSIKSNFFMGIFKHILMNFIYYFVINKFYDVNFDNIYRFLYSIYKLSLTKSYIPDMTITGITSVVYRRLIHISYINTNFHPEDIYFSPITFLSDLYIVTPHILTFSVLLFSLLLFCNYKIYCQKAKKSKFLKKKEKQMPTKTPYFAHHI
jgi:hypothetical protein